MIILVELRVTEEVKMKQSLFYAEVVWYFSSQEKICSRMQGPADDLSTFVLVATRGILLLVVEVY